MTKPTSKAKPLPKFRSQAVEQEFWEAKDNDATQFLTRRK